MFSAALAGELKNLSEEDAAWRLIRSNNAPWVITVLNAHLGGTTHKLPVPELVSLVEEDIEELKLRNCDFELNRSAQDYCEQWRRDGYLERHTVPGSRQETYELSRGAATAIRFVMGLLKPRHSATQSRLDTIVDRINKLALETDENVEHRRKALLDERARIDEQLAQLEEGLIEPIADDRAYEQVEDIISLAEEIPEDFLHVRADFEQISKQLHESIINSDAESEEILGDVFAGVDRIGDSPSGRSFKGFYTLLRDQELSEGTQDSIDAILERGFTDDLPSDERSFLRNLLRDFLEQSQETNAVKTRLAYGLQRYVQEQGYQRDRALKQELDRALGMVHGLLEVYSVHQQLPEPLLLSSVSIRPISRLRLHRPSDLRVEPLSLDAGEAPPPMTYEQLREAARETEIDFDELVGNVNEALAWRRKAATPEQLPATPSIAEVLVDFPATQGVASVVGLMSLAMEQGRPREGTESETVHWVSRAGYARKANIQVFEFYREVS